MTVIVADQRALLLLAAAAEEIVYLSPDNSERWTAASASTAVPPAEYSGM